MRLKNIKWIGAMTLSILFAYTIESCNEYTTLGEDLVSGSNDVEVMQTDTITVRTKTIHKKHDSVFASQLNYMAAGALNTDPIFGNTTAALYAQFGLASPEEEFTGEDPALDSVILSFRVSGHYGDSMNTQSYTVYRITDPSFSDTTREYYNHQKFIVDQGNPLGSITVTPDEISDSIEVVNSRQPAQLRIRLNNQFGNELISKAGSATLENDSAFHQWLNGLALIPDSTTPGRKSMIYYALNDDYTGISVFYHNKEDDSLFAYFPFNPNTGAWSNYQRHNYNGTPVQEAFQSSSQTDSIVYLQSNSGLSTNIYFPYINNLDSMLINKAELIITQIYDPSNETFTAPYELFLWKYANKTKDSIGYLIDAGATYSSYYGWQFNNLEFFGGLREKYTNQDNQTVAQYKFNISRHIQHIINASPGQEKNYGLRLGILDPLSRGPNIGRLALGGTAHAKYSMKLHLVYTKIK